MNGFDITSFIAGLLVGIVLIIFAIVINQVSKPRENIDLNNNHKIYYVRDNAGVNNVRLQFETLIVLTFLTNRTLMIPQPSLIDHYDGSFSEFDILDYDKLSKYIKIQFYSRKPDMKQLYILNSRLHDANYKNFPKDKDWWFDSGNSRIQHFQCLNLSKNDQKKALFAITNAIGLKQELFDILNITSEYLKIKDKPYNSIHIRRGDFLTFAKKLMLTEEDLAKNIRKELDPAVKIFIATNSDKEFLNKLISLLPEYTIITSYDFQTKINDTVQQAMADTLLCANALNFYGTPLSTMSTGIIQFRRILAMKYNKNILTEPKSIIPGKEFYETKGYSGGSQCWDRITRFK